MRASLLLLLLGACVADSGSRQVRVALRLHPATLGGENVRWDAAVWGLRALRVQPCAPATPFDPADTDSPLPRPQPWTTGLGPGVSLLDARRQRVPVGPWCGLDLVVGGPVVVSGQVGDSGPTVALRLDLPDLVAEDPRPFGAVVVTQRPSEGGGVETRAESVPLVLELGAVDWLASVDDGADVLSEPGSSSHDGLRDALLAGAALYLDPDRDGDLSEEERAAGLLAKLVPGPTASPAP